MEAHYVFGYPFDPEANCTGYYDYYYPQIGHTKSMLSEIVDDLLDTKALYYDLLDNGDTQGLLNFINDPTNSSIAVRNEMISCIPFISMDAWRAAFDRNPSMNPWHLAQVLLDASPLKKDVQKLMDEFEMDPYYKTLVMNAQSGGFTNQDLLEADLSMLGQEIQHIRNCLVNAEVFDNPQTSLFELTTIDAIDSRDPDLFISADIANLKGQHLEASVILGACGFNAYDEQLCEVLRQITLAERDADNCNNPLGSPLQSLQSIAAIPEHLGNALARAYLAEKNLGEWESDLYPSIIVRSINFERLGENMSASSLIQIQPNPANELVRFICKLPDGIESGQIKLYDSQIKLLQTIYVGPNLSITEFGLNKLSSGIYFFELYSEQIRLESGKWQVIH